MASRCASARVLVFGFALLGGPILCFLDASARAQGTSRGWTGGGATADWNDSANWSPAGVPAADDYLTLSLGDVAGLNTNNVSISNGGRLVMTNTTAVATLNVLTIASDGMGTLDISGGTLTTDTARIAFNENSQGFANLTGASTFWNISDATTSDLEVGFVGFGRLNVTGGADVTVADDANLGNSDSGIGIVDVVGSGSTLSVANSGTVLTVGVSGNGTLNAISSAAVTARATTIGSISSSVGKVTLDSFATLDNTSAMTVGDSGTGTLEIRGGAVATAGAPTAIADNAGSVGHVLVEGVGSLWDIGSSLTVGYNGTADLEIAGGARVESVAGNIGDFDLGQGSVVVRGSGSVWSNSSNLVVADRGQGALLIADGAAVENASSTVGTGAGAVGMVTVDGVGSTWTNSSAIIVGSLGSGTLNIGSGATVANSTASLGFFAGASGTANVVGGGARWTNTSLLRVGNNGSGALNISGGAVVTSNTASAAEGTGTGDIAIDGPGSRWSVAGGTFILGSNGSATIAVSNGGAFETAGGLNVANGNASISSITVAGLGSRLDVGQGLSLGNVAGTGAGSVTIGAGASADVGLFLVLQNANSGLTIDGGSLKADAFTKGAGALTFNKGTFTVDGGNFNVGSSYALNGATGVAELNLQGSGAATIGTLNVGNTGDAKLRLADGYTMTVGEGTIGPSGEIILDGGHLAAETLNNFAGGAFTFLRGTLTMEGDVFASSSPIVIPAAGVVDGSGFLEGNVVGQPGSTINVTATTLDMGNPFSFTGFVHQGVLNVGANVAVLRSAGFAQLGPLTTLAGGTINAANGVVLGDGDNLTGSGAVTARIAAGPGSTIAAQGGSLALGSSSSPIGFSTQGALNVGGNLVTLNDSNAADLGALTTLTTGGTLSVPNGAVIDFADNVAGTGLISSPDDPTKPIINNGSIVGDSLANPITLSGYVKGVGVCDNCNITGTDAPGFSPAAVTRGSVSYNGTLQIEVGGATPGAGYDQLNHVLGAGVADLGGTLEVSLINGFTPSFGDTFQIVTAASVLDSFAVASLPALPGGLQFLVDYQPTSVSLVVGLAGDFDHDGDVDGADVLVWQRGGSPTPNSAADLAAWRANYGAMGLAASATAVPEPPARWLSLPLMLLVSVRKRRSESTGASLS